MIDTKFRLLFSAASGEWLGSVEIIFHLKHIFSLNDVKKVLIPLISGRKLSTQIVGSSSPEEEGGTGGKSDGEEMFLTFHDDEDLQVKPASWKQNLKIHPVIHIQN